MKTNHIGILCAAATLAATAAAQNPLDRMAPGEPVRSATEEPVDDGQRLPEGLDLGGIRVPIHTAAPDGGVEYGVWAAADSYKAGFHGDMTFIPYLGSDYPQDQPFSWRTESVRAGGEELLRAGETPARWHDDFRYEYRFEAVTEAYDVHVEGLEQTFVIHRRPAGAGDIVVTGRVTTALRGPAFTAQRRSIPLFDDAGTQIIEYGAATAIDANGWHGDVLTAHENGRITLTVPAAWLRDAAYPVTIDPLLTGTRVTAGFPHYTTDIIRDDTANQIMVVHTRGSSASNQDGYAYIMNDNYSNRSIVFSDVTTSWSTDNIRCAVAASPQKYCVVFERHLSVGHRMRYHMHNSGDLTLRTTVTGINPPSGEHNWRPDIGGHVLPSGVFVPPTGTDFLLVYQAENTGSSTFSNTSRSTIRARLIGSNGVVGSEWMVQGGGLFGSVDYERPSVNQQARRPAGNPGTTSWLVAYQGYNNQLTRDDWDVHARLVTNSGTTSSSAWSAPSNGNPKHTLGPQVAGQSGRYLVAYTQRPVALIGPKTSSADGDAMLVTRVDWAAGGSPTNLPEQLIYGPFSAGPRMRIGSVGYDYHTDSHWVIQSASIKANGGSGRTILDRVGFNGVVTESVTLDAAGSGEQGLPGGVCFDDDNNLFLASWIMNGTTGSGYANKLDYVNPSSPVTQGTSCSSSTIAWSGSQQIGAEFTGVRISGAPGNALAFLVVALSTRNQDLTPLGMNGCYLLVQNAGPNYLGVVTQVLSTAGSGFVPLPLREFLNTDFFYYQWFHTEPGANSLGFTSTRRLRVHVVK